MNFLKKIYIYLGNSSKFFSRKGLYKLLAVELSKLPEQNIKALTVGSGGDTEMFIKKKFKNINLISIDNQKIKKPDIIMDVNNLNFQDNTYDLVLILEVIEHLKEPNIAIDQIYRVLKPNGTIILSTPFALEIHGAPNDFYRFTKYGLKFLLRRFKDINIYERNSYFESILVLYVRLIRSRFKTDKIFGFFFLILFFIILPINYIFSKLIRSDLITTGYVCSAKK